jgi:hypothetical protein
MYVTMSIVFPQLIVASKIIDHFNARSLGTRPVHGLSRRALVILHPLDYIHD